MLSLLLTSLLATVAHAELNAGEIDFLTANFNSE